jgi:enoyl-CoA hydratase/carnithine racemase
MSEASVVGLGVAQGVGTITIDSPANRNALSRAVTEGLQARFAEALADERVRVIVLTGTGNTFCAGADLKEQREANEAGTAAEGPRRVVGVMRTILDSPKPVVGRINGHARAGGMGLMAACDISVATEEATFSFSEVRLGLAPAIISVVTLPKMGITRGMEYFLTGDVFSAAQAAECRLITAVAPSGSLDEAVGRYLDSLLKGAPGALGASKRLVREIPGMPEDAAFAKAEAVSASFFASEEALEGMRAFAEKRPPRWQQG